MLEEEKQYWLAFSAFPGIGPLRFKILIDYFGSAKRAWQAGVKDLLEIGLGEKLTEKFLRFRDGFSISKYLANLKQKNINVLTLTDQDYPKLLKEIPAAPFVLYYRGNLEKINYFAKTIAVVGTRNVTSYGREVTKRLTSDLVGCGLTIVSGMAYGVDTVAHEAAIEAGGKTIAVLGCGVDIIHPPANSQLYWRIVNGKGVVISEYPVGQYALKGLFPARNRIISGLSEGVVVTQGARDSGALITARYAAEQGRDVFAVPGPITSEYSQAPTILLKQGAKLVTQAEDILEELKIQTGRIRKLFVENEWKNKKKQEILNLTKEEKEIIALLSLENLHFDELIAKIKFPAAKLASLLTLLEMKKIIKHFDNGIYGINDL